MKRAWRLVVAFGALPMMGCGDYVPTPEPRALREPRYALCSEPPDGRAYVQLDAAHRVVVCAFVMTGHMGEFRTTPQVLRVADTLFTTAEAEVPTSGGTGIMMDALGREPYRVLYGPVPVGTKLRVTNRANGRAPGFVALLDTTVVFR